MNFVDMLMYYAQSNPEKQAIILLDRIISFGMLGAGIRSVEMAVAEASLDSRHVVAVRIENRARHLIVVSALYRLGSCRSPLWAVKIYPRPALKSMLLSAI